MSVMQKSASYPDFHLEFDNGGSLKTKLYDFTFPIVNFSFIISNIPPSPTYGVYISQLYVILKLVPSTVILPNFERKKFNCIRTNVAKSLYN